MRVLQVSSVHQHNARNSRVEGKTESGLDTGAESLGVTEAEDTRVVDLGLDKGGVVLRNDVRPDRALKERVIAAREQTSLAEGKLLLTR